ncbi:peptidylprolyl isomerase [Solirubrobacter taibaiensis]|nr:peptidylprolyl isomerase [Solirubrobacter taibaiensis]
MLKFATLAAAITVMGPTYSGTIEDSQIAREAKRAEGSAAQRQTQALSVLIRRQWIEGEASERGIVVTETDAADRTAALTAEINAQIAEPAAKSVTPDQVRAYVDANPQVTPEQRTVRLVQTKNRRAAIAVLNRLKRGSTWSSLGATKETFDKADATKNGRAAFRAKLNRTTRYGRVVFRVIKHAPEKPVPRAQQEALAWETLASEAQQRALDEFTAQFTAKWRQRTTCAPPYAAHADCGQPPSGQLTP